MASLYYLFHLRSCACSATGNGLCNRGPATPECFFNQLSRWCCYSPYIIGSYSFDYNNRRSQCIYLWHGGEISLFQMLPAPTLHLRSCEINGAIYGLDDEGVFSSFRASVDTKVMLSSVHQGSDYTKQDLSVITYRHHCNISTAGVLGFPVYFDANFATRILACVLLVTIAYSLFILRTIQRRTRTQKSKSAYRPCITLKDAVRLSPGMWVRYLNSTGDFEQAEILKVHHDGEAVYYTIKTGSGKERQTERHRLYADFGNSEETQDGTSTWHALTESGC